MVLLREVTVPLRLSPSLLLSEPGHYRFAYRVVSGRLPAGVTLNSSTGRFVGDPYIPGSYAFVERASSPTGVAVTRAYTLLVAGPPICRATSAVGDVGTFMHLNTCAPFFSRPDVYLPSRFEVITRSGPPGLGSLPPGLTLWGQDASAAQIDGTPTVPGLYNFTIAAQDSLGGHSAAAVSVRIFPKLVLTQENGPKEAVSDVPYSARFAASGGDPPYTYQTFALLGSRGTG